MRVAAIQENGHPGLEVRPDPAAGEGEIVLRTLASGLCGTDLWKLATGSAAPGVVLGHEVVGAVTASASSRFEVGDRVVVPHHLSCGACRLCLTGAETQCTEFRVNRLDPGGFAELIRVDAAATATAAHRVPDGLDELDALFLEPAACVLRSIDRSRVAEQAAAPGRSRALILGGGSMGLLHLLVLRAVDRTAEIVVVDPREDRRELALALGAESAFAPGDARLARLEADAAFDCVGGAGLARGAIAALRPGGTAVLFAHARPEETPDFDLNDLFKHEKRLVGAYSGSLKEQLRVLDLLVSGALRPAALVSHRLPLASFEEGIELARTQSALKVVFHP
jgi:L-iditol 2-dehydrogenase